MTPHDIARAAADYDLHRRALVRCIAAEPHLDADDAPPCSGCLLATAKRLAIPPTHVSAPASASPSEVTRLLAEGVDGAAGAAWSAASPAPAAPPPETDNRPGGQSPRAAYRPNVLGQKQV